MWPPRHAAYARFVRQNASSSMSPEPLDPSEELVRIEPFARKVGAELDKACRAAGTPLPPGVSGAQLVAQIIDRMRQDTERWGPELRRITHEVWAEGRNASRESRLALLSSKVEQWLKAHPPTNDPNELHSA